MSAVALIAFLTGGCTGSSNSPNFVFQQQQLLVNGRVAHDPNTGQVLKFVHVKLGAAGGNGTFENPFGTVAQALAAALAGNIIYVQAGTNPGITGFTVPAGVSVLSAGPVQHLSTQENNQVILPLSGSTVSPVVTSTITLNNSSTLGGFDVNPPTGAGIQGTNVTGTLSVSNNVVRQALGGHSGIAIVSNAGTLTLNVIGNTVSNGTSSGVTIESDGTAQINATVTDNTVSNNTGSGIFFFLNNGQVTANISRNTTTGNKLTVPQESGIRFGVFNAAQGTVTMAGNTSTGNTGNGLFVGCEGTSHVMATFSGNTSNNNLGMGIFMGANGQGTMTGSIVNNTTTGNMVNNAVAPFPSGSGLFVGAQVNGNVTATVSNNTTTNNGDLGIFYFVANNGQGNVQILNNTSTGNMLNGIEVNAGLNGAPGNPANPGDVSRATATVSGNTVTGNLGIGPPLGGGGIFVLGFTTAVVHAAITNNTVSNNATGAGAFGGMGIAAVQTAQIFAGVRGNIFTGNKGANPAFTALSGVPATVLGGTLTGPAHICLQLTNNTSDSAYALLRPPGTSFQADFSNNVGGPIVQPAVPVDPLGTCAVP